MTPNENSKARQAILGRIKEGLKEKTPLPYPDVRSDEGIFPPTPPDEDLDLMFAEEVSKINGKFCFCESPEELVYFLTELCEQKGWKHVYCWEKELQDLVQSNDFRYCRIGKNLDLSEAGLTTCEALIARTGSILLSSRQASGRTLSLFPPVHIVVAYTDQLVYNVRAAINLCISNYEELPSLLTIASGPSRTADIEKTLVLGAHGPKELYVFLMER